MALYKEHVEKKLLEKQERQREKDIMIESILQMDENREKRALWSRLHEERRQAEMEEKLAKTKESEKWISKEYEQEEALAEELDRLNREELKKVKYRQLLLESPEIKDLQQQLRTAYVRKELAAQIELKKLEKLKEEYFEAKRNEQVVKEIEEAERKEKEEEFRQKEAYRKCLQDQMINKYKLQQENYKESLKEKALIDDTVRIIIEQDVQELEFEKMKKKKYREDIEAFKQARAVWLLKEKEAQDEEDRRIQSYMEQKLEWKKNLEDKVKSKHDALEKAKDVVTKILEQNMGTEEEREKVMQMLIQEEDRMKSEKKECDEAEKQVKAKVELREAFIQQIKDRLYRLEQEKMMEKEFAQQKLKEYEEDKRYQQMTKEKQRLMKMEYMLCIQKELEERQKKRQTETAELLELQKMEKEARETRVKMLEEERIKLLQDHAGKLVGYLPKGILKSSDLPHLSPDIKEFYNPKPSSLGQPPR